MSTGIPILDVFGAYQAAKGEAAQAQQARINAQLAQLQGVESAEMAQSTLQKTIGAISSIQEARGVSSDSPTAQAITGEDQNNAYRNEAIQQLGFLNKAAGYNVQAQGYQMQSNLAIPMAIGGDVGNIVKGFSDGYGG